MTAPDALPSVPVTLYTRAGCHLCEEAAAGLEAIGREFPIDVHPVDIDLDLTLLKQFNDIAPAIAVADRLVTNAPIDLDAVRGAVRSALSGRQSIDSRRGHF